MSAQPRMAHGLPYCAEEACEEYDGKRCRLMGCQPTSMCEPAVGLMQLKIERVQALPAKWRHLYYETTGRDHEYRSCLTCATELENALLGEP